MTFNAGNTGFSKSIFQSVTFWGAVISALSLAVPTLAAKFNITASNSAQIAQDIVTAIGFLVTVYGRFTAKTVVTLTGGAPPSPTALSGTKG